MTQQGAYILDYIPDGFMTRKELAEALDVRYHTVYMWERAGKLVPDARMDAGQLPVSLYARERVESMVRESRLARAN